MRTSAVELLRQRREARARLIPKKTRFPTNSTLSMRAGAGLGDAIYLQSVARHFSQKGMNVEVCTFYPDVFRPLHGVKVSRFRRDGIKKVAHYSGRRGVIGTDQFQDCCISAGIREPVDFRLDWVPRNPHLVGNIRGLAKGRPIVFVQLPRNPMGRIDKYGDELLPDCSVIQSAINMIGDRAFKVQVGKGQPRYVFRGLDMNLANKTTVSDLLDIGAISDGFLGYCSFMIPLAESQRKPALLVWSRRGLNSHHELVRRITPVKIFHRPELMHYVIDDCSNEQLTGAVNGFLEQVASARQV